MTSSDQILEVLRGAGRPLSPEQIASELDVSVADIDEILWSDTDRFQWQPGHLWSIGKEKTRTPDAPRNLVPSDVRGGTRKGRDTVELRAIVLDDGTRLRISKRPLDGEALFSSRRHGADLEIVMNSAHDVFDSHEIPFANDEEKGSSGDLLELFIEAWALFEDSMDGTQAKRTIEDARRLIGRRMGDLTRRKRV